MNIFYGIDQGQGIKKGYINLFSNLLYVCNLIGKI